MAIRMPCVGGKMLFFEPIHRKLHIEKINCGSDLICDVSA